MNNKKNNRVNQMYIFTIALTIFTLYFGQNVFAQEKKNQILMGFTSTPSFPIADFADKSITNKDAGYATSNNRLSNYQLDFELIFKQNLGVSASYLSEDYGIEKYGSNYSLSFASITVGPMYSFSLTNRFALDLKCQFGYVGSLISIDGNDNYLKEGNGLGVNIGSMLRYQIFKRWYAIAQCGYFSSNQNFNGVPNIKIQALNAGLGVGFRIR